MLRYIVLPKIELATQLVQSYIICLWVDDKPAVSRFIEIVNPDLSPQQFTQKGCPAAPTSDYEDGRSIAGRDGNVLLYLAPHPTRIPQDFSKIRTHYSGLPL